MRVVVKRFEVFLITLDPARGLVKRLGRIDESTQSTVLEVLARMFTK
jgi:hypothetical protein